MNNNNNNNDNDNDNIDLRPNWDEYFKEIAIVTSKRSPCERLNVGCVLVKDNRIISQGYNGFLPGFPHKSIIRDNHEQATIHAEQNAICDCAKRGVSCDGSTAYITHYPCIICSRLLIASGISKIYYINDYNNDDLVEYFTKEKHIEVIKI
jgi:dCMP deaminase